MDYSTDNFDYGDWGESWFIKGNKPYMVYSSGKPAYELDPNDYTKKLDGSDSDVSNLEFDGNCMAMIPLVWLYQYEDDDYAFCYVCSKKLDDNYEAYAHQREDESIMDYIWLSCFEASLNNEKLRSLKGYTPSNNQSVVSNLECAKKNGNLWSIRSWSHRNLISMLLVLIGKSTNSQDVFGNGNVSGGRLTSTGEFYNKGGFYGTNINESVKVFHLENLWGDLWEVVQGVVMNDKAQIVVKMTPPYNTNGEGYTNTEITISGSQSGYINESIMKKYGGYLPKTASGSATTYDCDGLWYENNGYCKVGGCCNDVARSGLFALSLYGDASYSDKNYGVALSCEQHDNS